jgi:hypothetical protein
MLHELVHVWMFWKKLPEDDNVGHGPIFRAKYCEAERLR